MASLVDKTSVAMLYYYINKNKLLEHVAVKGMYASKAVAQKKGSTKSTSSAWPKTAIKSRFDKWPLNRSCKLHYIDVGSTKRVIVLFTAVSRRSLIGNPSTVWCTEVRQDVDYWHTYWTPPTFDNIKDRREETERKEDITLKRLLLLLARSVKMSSCSILP